MPLIGREEELELVLRRWRQATDGEGRNVSLTGEPGIGKSRLIAELEARLATKRQASLRYFCSPLHQGSHYPIIARWEQDTARMRTPRSSDCASCNLCWPPTEFRPRK